MNTNVNWEEVKRRVTSFGVKIYPLEECIFGKLIGAGAAMIVFEGEWVIY